MSSQSSNYSSYSQQPNLNPQSNEISNIYDLDMTLTLNNNGYGYWTDSQHYHYDHHDYHESQSGNIYGQAIQYPMNLPYQQQINSSTSIIFHQQKMPLGQGVQLNGPGIPGNPRIPIGQSDFFQRMHMLSPSSSDSDDDNDFDPPFATSLPRNQDFNTNNNSNSNSSSNGNSSAYDSNTIPMINLSTPSSTTAITTVLNASKPSTVIMTANRTTTIPNTNKSSSSTGNGTSTGTAIIIHTPMFKSTRDENGKYHETRKNCLICKKRINTFCRDCAAALCFGDGKETGTMTCWEKHHHNIAISAMQSRNTSNL